jgi:hypothetical protein
VRSKKLPQYNSLLWAARKTRDGSVAVAMRLQNGRLVGESGIDSRHNRSFPQHPKRGWGPPTPYPVGTRGTVLQELHVGVWSCNWRSVPRLWLRHYGKLPSGFTFRVEVMKPEQSDRKQPHSAVPQHSCRLANCYRLSSDVSGAAAQFCGYDKVDKQLKYINHNLA